MPTYEYECEFCAVGMEANVPIAERDMQYCARCGMQFKRKVVFHGLTWAPTAGGYR